MLVICYNQARFVVEALESVRAQTYKNTELIVVDDCSTDDSVAVIDRWLAENKIQCTFIRHERNQGVCKTLNDALAVATGKYVSETAADDLWLPDRIERQVAIMELQPESVGVLYSDAVQIDENGNKLPEMFIEAHRKLPQMPEGRILDTLLEGNFIPAMTTLIRRACYGKVGIYDEGLPWEDWDMWMRIARHYSFVYSGVPSAKYRRHPASFSRCNPMRMFKDSLRVSIKQFAVGNLTEDQRSRLTARILDEAERLYVARDNETADILRSLATATGHNGALWMSRFASIGMPHRIWKTTYGLRARALLAARRLTGLD